MNLFNKETFTRNAVFTALTGFIDGVGFSSEAMIQKVSEILSENKVVDVYSVSTVTVVGVNNLTAVIKTSYADVVLDIRKEYRSNAYNFVLRTTDPELKVLGQFIDIVE